jgi:hypothetical protein
MCSGDVRSLNTKWIYYPFTGVGCMVQSTSSRRYRGSGGGLPAISITMISVFCLLVFSSGCIGQPEMTPTSTPSQGINETLKDQMYSILGINPISVVYQDDVLFVEYATSFSGDSPQFLVDEMQKVCSLIIKDFAGETPPELVTIQVIADRGKTTYTTRMNWMETMELGNIGMSYNRWHQFTEITEE